MRAVKGDRVVIRGRHIGQAERHGEVLEARGENDGPPFLVRFDDGHETLLFPGTDCELEHAPAG